MVWGCACVRHPMSEKRPKRLPQVELPALLALLRLLLRHRRRRRRHRRRHRRQRVLRRHRARPPERAARARARRAAAPAVGAASLAAAERGVQGFQVGLQRRGEPNEAGGRILFQLQLQRLKRHADVLQVQ